MGVTRMKIKISKIGINAPTAFIGLYATFVLEKVYFISENTVLFSIIDFLQWLFLLYFAYKLVSRNYNMKLLLALLAIIIVFGISYYECRASNYLKFALIIVASFGLKYDSFFRDIRRTYLLLILPIFLLGIAGIIPSTIVRRGYSTYGFVHTNVIAMFVLSIVACYIIEKNGKLRLRNYVVITLTDAVLWVITDTRSSCAIILLLLIINALLQTKLFSKINRMKFSHLLVYALIPLATAFSFYLAINYESNSLLIESMNKVTSNRIYMAWIVFSRMTPSLFGNYISGDLVENAYIISIYQYGIIATLVVFAFYIYALNSSIKRNDFATLAVLICFIVHGIIEGSTFEPFVNIALVPIAFNVNLQSRGFKGKRKDHDKHIYTNI